MDIKIRKRTRSVQEIEIEIMSETSEYLIRRGEYMHGTHRTRQKDKRRPNELGTSEPIDEFLDEAFG